ncbi:coiled-coil domain-containing protein 90B, mitochondrial isoform X2 [Hypanus sabinus]|uniref:coiled-coil domain-containing protein 90B, mitochondrial isoform X2 n=1 Tax=Hypanus sabinus TaxID=79690 RepID=UPI0028C4D71A|nr:coiled-coil domain-containing protein 90B, mitochondrial isoform X2 [Hypanus sabinus]
MKLIRRCKTLLEAYNFRALDLQRSLAESPRMYLKRSFFAATSSCVYDPKVDLLSQEQRRMCFDTHALVLELQSNGFSKEQAEAIVTIIANITNANMESTYRDLVTKAQQIKKRKHDYCGVFFFALSSQESIPLVVAVELMLHQIMAHLDSIRKDMVILEKSEFSSLRMENEKIKIELEHVKQQLTDEVKKIRNDTKLDMNLEKSRIMDLFREQEKQLMTSKNEFTEMNSDTDRAITETNKKIDTDVASLKTMLESLKLETMRPHPWHIKKHLVVRPRELAPLLQRTEVSM